MILKLARLVIWITTWSVQDQPTLLRIMLPILIMSHCMSSSRIFKACRSFHSTERKKLATEYSFLWIWRELPTRTIEWNMTMSAVITSWELLTKCQTITSIINKWQATKESIMILTRFHETETANKKVKSVFIQAATGLWR